MIHNLRRRSLVLLGGLSTGLMVQSTCPLSEDFDAITLFAQAASTIVTDSIFFALDSFLLSF